MSRNVIFSRAVLYSDGSSIETGVEFSPTLRLGNDDQSYFRIEGVGEPVTVRVDHIPLLIDWMQAVAEADREYRESAIASLAFDSAGGVA